MARSQRTGRGVDGKPGRRYELTMGGSGLLRWCRVSVAAASGPIIAPSSTACSGCSTPGAVARHARPLQRQGDGLRPLSTLDPRGTPSWTASAPWRNKPMESREGESVSQETDRHGETHRQLQK